MASQPQHDPGHYGNDEYDLTGHVGPLSPELCHDRPWPMYSYDRPAHMLWNAIGKQLHAQGWSDAQIKEWLQSKQTRWALDGSLGDQIETLGKLYAANMGQRDT